MQNTIFRRIVASFGALSLSSLALLAFAPLGATHFEPREDANTGPDQPFQPTQMGGGEGPSTGASGETYRNPNPYTETNETTAVTPFQPPYPESSVYGESNPDTNIRGYVGGGYPGEPYADKYPAPREGLSTSPTAGPSSPSYSTNGSDVNVTTGYGTGGIGTTGSTLSVSPNNPTPVTGY